MRGLLTLILGKEIPLESLRTALVVCTADENTLPSILDSLQYGMPWMQFTFVAPEAYRSFLPPEADVYQLVELKRKKRHYLKQVRARRFDLTVVMLTGAPIFRKAKLWAFLTNYRLLMVYNENLDSFCCSREQVGTLARHLRWRLRERGWPDTPVSAGQRLVRYLIVVPMAFFYLSAFAALLWLRQKRMTKQ